MNRALFTFSFDVRTLSFTRVFFAVMSSPSRKRSKPTPTLDKDVDPTGNNCQLTSANGLETFTFFYGAATIFSNFFPSTFVVEGRQFNCAEQYFHYMKAVQFKDNEMAGKILSSKSPKEQKALGRKVKNYNQREWDEAGPLAMKNGLRAKFGQNPELKAILLKSVGTTLVEASPRDRKWGIGLGKDNPKAIDRRAWRGQNLLGKILMQVRDELGEHEGAESAEGTSKKD